MPLQRHILHKFEHNLCIININECLVAKNLLMNVTKTNEHSNVTTFVHALHQISANFLIWPIAKAFKECGAQKIILQHQKLRYTVSSAIHICLKYNN